MRRRSHVGPSAGFCADRLVESREHLAGHKRFERCYHPAMRSGYFRSFSPAYVDSVRDSSPATEAGIETGDVLVHVDDRPASGAESRHDQWPGRRMTPGIVPTKALQPCWAVDEFCANAQPYQVSEVPDFDRRPQMR